jgi:signal peptidase I
MIGKDLYATSVMAILLSNMNPESPSPTPVNTPPRPDRDPSTLQLMADKFSGYFSALFSWIIFPVLVVLGLHFFVFQAYHVVGTSMVNTLHDADYLIISKLGDTGSQVERLFGNKTKVYIPKRGEILVFHFPLNPQETFVKRVIGIPGDRVVIKNGAVTLYTKDKPNGYNPDESYEKPGTITLIETDVTIPAGNVFVMGDNRSDGGSYDSRSWGLLPSSYIIGNAVIRLLPLDQVRIF